VQWGGWALAQIEKQVNKKSEKCKSYMKLCNAFAAQMAQFYRVEVQYWVPQILQ
jgi:hypothetical protein